MLINNLTWICYCFRSREARSTSETPSRRLLSRRAKSEKTYKENDDDTLIESDDEYKPSDNDDDDEEEVFMDTNDPEPRTPSRKVKKPKAYTPRVNFPKL